ncbi:MAG: hypothetical protein R3246_15630, partial [Acidimicrobiia bacterium]|nr:hypothetical protein [Acidimicrobiia bacterium]
MRWVEGDTTVAWTDSIVMRAFDNDVGRMYRILARNDRSNPIVGVSLRSDGWTLTTGMVGGDMGEANRSRSFSSDSIVWLDFDDLPDGIINVGGFVATLGAVGDGDRVAFPIRVQYSDGSVVDWSGPPDSAYPAPTLPIVSEATEPPPTWFVWSGLILLALGLARIPVRRLRAARTCVLVGLLTLPLLSSGAARLDAQVLVKVGLADD